MPQHTEHAEGPASAGSSAVKRPVSTRRWWLWVVAIALLTAFVLASVVRGFVADVYWVGSDSMEPTLQGGDRVLVDKLVSGNDVARGELVVFDGRGSLDPLHSTDPWHQQVAHTLGRWLGVTGSDTAYVKRVIGVAGDTVSCCTADGLVTVNGRPQHEDYVFPGDEPSRIPFTVHVPEGRVWLMGDHRTVSVDSRSLLGSPGGGLIRTERIVGTAERVVWPPERARTLRE
ncbi:signal peptidase I [Kocuria marina]|uniref:signal peptidase I n=1 Tax=Kocuria marina TaxID=223184 RepID=UPI002989D908|nr:signal peptidase I [Kocuria marina]MCT2361672.1 signal peptidase I [Kocuria marina]